MLHAFVGLIAAFDVAFLLSNCSVNLGDCKSMRSGSAQQAGLEPWTVRSSLCLLPEHVTYEVLICSPGVEFMHEVSLRSCPFIYGRC